MPRKAAPAGAAGIIPAALTAAALTTVAVAAAGCSGPQPATHTVEIRGFAYIPATLRVAPGDTVVWINRDVVPHTVTDEGTAWDSGSLDAEATWRIVADSAASGEYYCVFHPTMRGELVVR